MTVYELWTEQNWVENEQLRQATEVNMIKRTTEAYVVQHSDFMTFLPFKSRLLM